MNIHYSSEYNDTGVAFDTTRKGDAVAQSLRTRPIPGTTLVAPQPLTHAELLLAHHRDYIEAVRTGTPRSMASGNGIGWDDRLFAAVCASNGGMRDAVRVAMRTGGNSGTLSSGLHHASSIRGSGYCTFNGLAIAAKVALLDGAQRVVILDLDAHCGGGTTEIIAGSPAIQQVDVSVVSFDRYDDTDNVRLVLSDSESYLDDVEMALTSIENPITVDVLIYNAGMDPHQRAGGVHGITTRMLARREQMVFEWARAHAVPVAWTLAGGYTGSIDMDELVDLHRLTIEAAVASAG